MRMRIVGSDGQRSCICRRSAIASVGAATTVKLPPSSGCICCTILRTRLVAKATVKLLNVHLWKRWKKKKKKATRWWHIRLTDTVDLMVSFFGSVHAFSLWPPECSSFSCFDCSLEEMFWQVSCCGALPLATECSPKFCESRKLSGPFFLSSSSCT